MAAEEGSQREMEEFIAGTGIFGGEEQPEAEETGETVHDLPPDQQPPPDDGAETPPPSPEPTPATDTTEEDAPEEVEAGEPHIVWARKKYGTDPEKWAKAAYDQERFISTLSGEKKQAELIAQNAIEYAQQVEMQARAETSMTMPLSASEEQWVEESAANPAAYAYQAARAGNVQLYNAVIENVAMENPAMAAQIGTQVNMSLQQEMAEAQQAAPQQNGDQPQDFTSDLEQSFGRVGVNVKQYGDAMWQKFTELGEYHPYTLAVMGGDPMQRDLAVSAVYDLIRQGQVTTQRIGDETREAQIAREGELRRNAASVVTGSPHVAPAQQNPMLAAMEEEWKRKGQWTDEE